jgi:hypothetical protein
MKKNYTEIKLEASANYTHIKVPADLRELILERYNISLDKAAALKTMFNLTIAETTRNGAAIYYARLSYLDSKLKTEQRKIEKRNGLNL